jgi:peptidoglycan/xylan/chitin deacetylase (PgdA/CDA1 family)
MKRMIRLTVTLATLILILASCAASYDTVDVAIRPEVLKGTDESRSPELGIHSIVEEEEDQTIAVHYPITGHKKIDAILSEFALNRIELFRQDTANIQVTNEEVWPYELHIDYEIVYETSRHLSLIFKESKYLGGAQPSSAMYTYNFNLEQGRQLTLKDLFKGSSAYLEILSQYIRESLIDNHVLNIALDDAWVVKGSQPLESNFKHFVIKENSLVILFEKYQIGSAFIGEPSLEIPFDVFTAHIELKEVTLAQPSTEITPTETTESPVQTEPTTTETVETTTSELISTDEKVIAPVLNRKKIAITFEDGPHPIYTPLILDTLKSRNKVATFFVMGNRADEYPMLIKRIYGEGHLLGNHSWSHAQLTRLSNEHILSQIEKTNETIAKYTGFTPYIYRPPYGIYNENVISTADMPAILWSIDPLDLKFDDSAYITNYVLDHAFDGAIVLLRDTNQNTTQAFSAILDGLIKEGFDIVTVDELLEINPENSASNVRIFSRGAEIK